MTKQDKGLGRRDFIVGAAAIVAGAGAGIGGAAALGGCSDDSGPTKDSGPGADGPAKEAGAGCDSKPSPLAPVSGASTVVEVQDPKSVSSFGVIDAPRAKAMLIAGLNKLAGTTDIKQAWKTLLPDFSQTMTIGLKTNCLSTKLYNSTELLTALIETLVNDLGADSSKIWVWDRRTDELTRSKLSKTSLKVKVAGTIVSTSDSSGPGYETQEQCVLEQATHLSTILTKETDITINLPLLKTHGVSGITGAMKNVYGCIDNPGDFHTGFNDDLPAIYRLDQIHKHLRLHITEALKAVTRGETTAYPDTMAGRLLLSTDPVALDTQALKVTNALRAAKSVKPVDSSLLKWLDGAAALNLGTKSVKEELVKITT
jgi:uncharacterized protein (DUF362 family)